MAARRCRDCGISFPTVHASTCDVCDRSLDYVYGIPVDGDWKEKVSVARAVGRGDGGDAAVREWRREELERAGYEGEHARALARRPDVDLRLAVRLLRDGCPRPLALRILL